MSVEIPGLGAVPTFTRRGPNCGAQGDPINVLAINGRAVDLANRLLGRQNCDTKEVWRRTRLFVGDQSLHLAGRCVVQGEQIVSGHLWYRVHLRAWDAGGSIGALGGSHFEFGLTLGVGLRNAAHRPPSFESARDSIHQDLTGQPRVPANETVDLDNYVRDPYASGHVLVIR
jgi:hypothetical protein